jgi:hypothetical protein
MDSQASPSRSFGPGPILGIVGGALLVIGSLMTWATVSFNVENIANALGVDPSIIPPGSLGSQSVAGTKVSDGKIALVCGIIVVIAAVALLAVTGARVWAAAVLMLAGLVGGGIALYDGINGKDDAINDAARALTAQGLPGDVKSFFNVSIGIGIWICVIGGIAAIVAGILVLMQRGQAVAPAAMGGTMSAPMGGGDMASSAGTGVPPTAPPAEAPATMPPAAEAPTTPPPAPEMPSTPEPPPTPPADTPGAAGDAPTS